MIAVMAEGVAAYATENTCPYELQSVHAGWWIRGYEAALLKANNNVQAVHKSADNTSNELAWAIQKYKNPPRKRKNPLLEKYILKACLDYLQKACKLYVWRNNVGAMAIGDRFQRFGMPGSADIIGLLPDGRFLAVECKQPGKKQNPAQVKFQKNIEANDGVYLLIHSLDELKELWSHV